MAGALTGSDVIQSFLKPSSSEKLKETETLESHKEVCTTAEDGEEIQLCTLKTAMKSQLWKSVSLIIIFLPN